MAATKSSGMWSLINEIDHSKTSWALRVRVVRVFEVAAHARGGNTLEMVLHDEEGTRIHAVVKRPQVALFRPQVMEDNVYAMKNFMVHDNYQLYKTTSHPYILEFVSKTKVVHLDYHKCMVVHKYSSHSAVKKSVVVKKWLFPIKKVLMPVCDF